MSPCHSRFASAIAGAKYKKAAAQPLSHESRDGWNSGVAASDPSLSRPRIAWFATGIASIRPRRRDGGNGFSSTRKIRPMSISATFCAQNLSAALSKHWAECPPSDLQGSDSFGLEHEAAHPSIRRSADNRILRGDRKCADIGLHGVCVEGRAGEGRNVGGRDPRVGSDLPIEKSWIEYAFSNALGLG